MIGTLKIGIGGLVDLTEDSEVGEGDWILGDWASQGPWD